MGERQKTIKPFRMSGHDEKQRKTHQDKETKREREMGGVTLLQRMVIRECVLYAPTFKQRRKKAVKSFCGIFQAEETEWAMVLGRNVFPVPLEQ